MYSSEFPYLFATMKTWLILIYLATTLIPSFSWEVMTDANIIEAETEESEPYLPTNNRLMALFWQVFAKMVTSDKSHDNAMEKLGEEDRQKEGSPAEKEANKKVREEKGTVTGCKQTSVFEDDVLECLDATELPARASATAEPATTLTTADETINATCISKQCQPGINPWASCTNSTSEDKEMLFEALTTFAVELYKTVIRHENRDSNLIFSPFSIATMFSNLLLGACDETKDRLEKLLFYPEGFTCVHKMLETLQKSKALTSTNAMFFQPTLTLESDFLNLTQSFYQTKLAHITNNSNQAVLDINAWVSKVTNGKIKTLVDELDSDVQMVLLNAVYFHSKWKTIFKVKNTNKEKFYLPDVDPIEVLMMMSKKYPVASFIDQSLQAKVGRLQLSDNMSLIIIMPRSLSQKLSDVEWRLSATVFKSMMAKLETTPFKPTIVTLPKFKVDSSQNLKEIIGAMDYGLFYDANLCGISKDEELAVSSAQHRAVLEISEEGVEAAAATAVSLARTANFFEVQQPFLFSLAKNNGFPVFMGRINNPQPA
ncbi:plasma protease C1 inhibitor isoform X2 [Rhineura floridana]|uniref:plasma protease C1 inhibitor isoform X2 n=1 Tax=Rhineura floridana TaxID=261503 RepID=UPI002AC84332|nr:plasma protease C1 inhibitor isoform X2 [Rhineura floridana]